MKWDAFDWLFANPWEANFLQCRHFLFSVELIFRSKIARPTFGTIYTKIAQPFFGNQNKVFYHDVVDSCQKVKIYVKASLCIKGNSMSSFKKGHSLLSKELACHPKKQLGQSPLIIHHF